MAYLDPLSHAQQPRKKKRGKKPARAWHTLTICPSHKSAAGARAPAPPPTNTRLDRRPLCPCHWRCPKQSILLI